MASFTAAEEGEEDTPPTPAARAPAPVVVDEGRGRRSWGDNKQRRRSMWSLRVCAGFRGRGLEVGIWVVSGCDYCGSYSGIEICTY